MSRLDTVSVTDALIRSLRALVLDGRVDPGDGITENDLAAEFEVSRPTARVAITHVVQEGLLRRDARRPAYVPRLSPADVEDLFLVRIPLELEVVRLLGDRRGGSLPDAAGAVEDLRVVDEAQPDSVFVEADLRFHRALIARVASPRLSRHFDLLSGEMHLSMVQSRSALGRERIAAEHGEVLAAVLAGDIDHAVRLMEGHLVGARDAMVRALAVPVAI
jgi:DNA-binding GntR family transcriptional regulator